MILFTRFAQIKNPIAQAMGFTKFFKAGVAFLFFVLIE
jgi:hypothetical protein